MNVGLHDGIVDPKHEKAMGGAIWLYLWLVWRQTKSSGLVLGGIPLTYKEISRRSGFPARTIRFWLDRLRKFEYVRVAYRNYMMISIRITKPKKFAYKQKYIPFSDPQDFHNPLTENCQGVRQKTVKGVTQNCQPKQSVSMNYIESNTTARPQNLRAMHQRLDRESERQRETRIGAGPSSEGAAGLSPPVRVRPEVLDRIRRRNSSLEAKAQGGAQ